MIRLSEDLEPVRPGRRTIGFDNQERDDNGYGEHRNSRPDPVGDQLATMFRSGGDLMGGCTLRFAVCVPCLLSHFLFSNFPFLEARPDHPPPGASVTNDVVQRAESLFHPLSTNQPDEHRAIGPTGSPSTNAAAYRVQLSGRRASG